MNLLLSLTFKLGRCSMVVHFISRQSLPCAPYSAPLFPSHPHKNYYTFSTSFPRPFFASSPTFVVHLLFRTSIVAFAFLRPPISFYSCAFFNAHVSASYTSAGLTNILYTFPLILTFILLSHNTPDTLFQFSTSTALCG